jgi:hypothetical protein
LLENSFYNTLFIVLFHPSLDGGYSKSSKGFCSTQSHASLDTSNAKESFHRSEPKSYDKSNPPTFKLKSATMPIVEKSFHLGIIRSTSKIKTDNLIIE